MSLPHDKPDLMTPGLSLLLVILILCTYSTLSNAQMSDYERSKIEQFLHHPEIEKKLEVFDGETFNINADLDAAYRYMTEFTAGTKKLVQAINGMSGPGRRSDQGRIFIAEAQDKLAYTKAMAGAFRGFERLKKIQTDKKAAQQAHSNTSVSFSATTHHATETVNAVITTEQSNSVQVHLDRLNALMASDTFDGESLDPSLSLDDAQLFQQQFLQSANSATTAYNLLATEAKKSAVGKTLRQSLEKHLTIARQLNGALLNHRVHLQQQLAVTRQKKQADQKQQRETAARLHAERELQLAQAAAVSDAQLQEQRNNIALECQNFSAEVMTRRHRHGMTTFLHNPDAFASDYQAMSAFLKVVDRVAVQCSRPDYSKLLNTSCSDSPDQDPKAWCEAAMTAKDTLRDHLLREHSGWETIAEERYMSAAELGQNQGWIQIEGPVNLDKVLSFDRMMHINTVDFGPEKQRQFFTDLGIKPTDFPHYNATLEYISELREAIEDGADSWPKAPRAITGNHTNYGTALAASNVLERWHQNAVIKDAWLARANWKIIKNSLGIIQRRTLPGYVLFKLPEDPYCQLRSFTLTEQYTGDGTFQPAKGVRFGYVRFQACE